MPPIIERGLLWSEKYIKTDMVYLARSGFWLLFGQVTTLLSVLALSIVFANFLPKETYGTYKYILSLTGIFSIFTLPGMTTALIRATARGFDRSIILATKTRARYGILGLIVGLCAAAYYYVVGNSTLSLGLLLISFFLPVFDTFGTYNGYLQGKQQFRRQALMSLFVQTVASGALIAAVYFSGNLYVILATYLALYTLLRFVSWYWTVRHDEMKAGADPEMVPYAKHLSVMSVLGLIASQADLVLLFHFLGSAEVAIYAIAIAPAEHIKSIIATANDSLLPRLARHSEKAVRQSILLKCVLLFTVVAALVGLYILFASSAFAVFFPKYTDAVFISQIFSLSLLSTFFTPMNIFLQAHGKIKEQYYANTLTYVFQIISMTAGVIFFGLIGLVVARIMTRYLFGLLIFLFYRLSARTGIA